MGTRIAVMNEGLLQQVGTPQALYDTPINRFVAGFIGSPSMNFVEVHVDGAGDSARLVGAGRLVDPAPARYREAATPTGRQDARRRVPARAPRHRRGRSGCRLVPGPGGRRRVPRQRGAAPRQRRRPGHRRDRRVGAPRPARRHRQPRPAARQAAPVRRRDRPDARRRTRWPPPERSIRPTRPNGPGGSLRGRSRRARRRVAGPPSRPVPDVPGRHDRAGRRLARPRATSPVTRARSRSSRSTTRTASCSSASTGSRSARSLLEIPAGTLDVADDGSIEDPELAAPRELEEETGMRAGTWRTLARFCTAPGFRLRADAPVPRDGPRAGRRRSASAPTRTSTSLLERMPWRDALAAAERGEIRDAKSILALLWLARLRADAAYRGAESGAGSSSSHWSPASPVRALVNGRRSVVPSAESSPHEALVEARTRRDRSNPSPGPAP